jgi:uncharacterized protein (DUF736 family)
MTQIGLFEATPNGFTGRISTVGLERDIRIVEGHQSDAHNAPDYRIVMGDEDEELEIGAAWKQVGKKAGTYLSIQIDDPLLPRPIRANLFQSSSDPTVHILIWKRPRNRAEQE